MEAAAQQDPSNHPERLRLIREFFTSSSAEFTLEELAAVRGETSIDEVRDHAIDREIIQEGEDRVYWRHAYDLVYWEIPFPLMAEALEGVETPRLHPLRRLQKVEAFLPGYQVQVLEIDAARLEGDFSRELAIRIDQEDRPAMPRDWQQAEMSAAVPDSPMRAVLIDDDVIEIGDFVQIKGLSHISVVLDVTTSARDGEQTFTVRPRDRDIGGPHTRVFRGQIAGVVVAPIVDEWGQVYSRPTPAPRSPGMATETAGADHV